MFVCNSEAIEEIISVRGREKLGIFELSKVRGNIVVLFNSFDDVAFALHLEEFLGDDNVSIVKSNSDVGEITIYFIEGSWVTERALVVWNRPCWGCHYSQVVVSIGVHAGGEGTLAESSAGHCLTGES